MAALPAEYRPSRRWRWPAAPTAWTFIRPLLRDAPAHMAKAPCWCWKSATSAPTLKPPFPRLNPVWLETSAGDDQVLLLTRDALRPPA
jgi:ribosomal protein L3 glutamine methyltransferase